MSRSKAALGPLFRRIILPYSRSHFGVLATLVVLAATLGFVQRAPILLIEVVIHRYQTPLTATFGGGVGGVSLPAMSTVGDEIGDHRYPTGMRTMKARSVKPKQISAEELPQGGDGAGSRMTVVRQFVETVTGNCEFLEGGSPAAVATELVKRLREERVIE